jgi:hypothetical protein
MKGEIKADSIKISRLRTKILEGEIKIPPFQREFVWNEEQIIELLDSIYKDYPIGSVLFWETNENLKARREVGGFHLPDTEPELPLFYVLDGQQRITSIFGVFCHEKITKVNEEIALKFDIVFDLNEKEFKMTSETNDEDLVIPLKLLFDNYAFNQHLNSDARFDEHKTMEAAAFQEIFQNYDLPTVIIKKRAIDEVGIIFERVNSTGTPLSTLDLLTAWTWSESYYLKEVFDNIYDLLETKNFGNFKDKLILQCFSGVLSESTKTVDILSLNPEEVQSQTPTIINSIKKALDLLSTEFNVKTDEFLPKPQQFVGLVYLFSKIVSPTADQLKVIRKWFWRTAFSNRYSAGTDEKMNEDILFFKKIIANDFESVVKYKSDLSEELFIKKTLSKSNSWSRATLLLLSAKKPQDLTNGVKIDVGKSLSSFNRKEYHHIFPREFLKTSFSLSTPEINRLVNFCFLPASSNKAISNKPPSEYFFNLIPSEIKKEILDSNFIPNTDDIYKENDYSKFCNERAKFLFAAAKQKTEEN